MQTINKSNKFQGCALQGLHVVIHAVILGICLPDLALLDFLTGTVTVSSK